MWPKLKRRKTTKMNSSSAQAPTAAYYSSDSVRIDNLDFDRPNQASRVSRVQRIDVGDLVGASVFESAVCSSAHVEALVFEELAESMQVIERKFHGGQYDAQAMPLVEAFLSELRTLAHIQMERNGIVDQRIADMKQANIAAYQAVCEARARREEGIDKARLYDLRLTALKYDRREAKIKRRYAKKAKEDDLAFQQEEIRKARREEKSRARKARMQHRHERRMRQEQVRAEQEERKWQMKQERSELDLEKLRGEKAIKQAERMTQQAMFEADAEVARANKHMAQMREEQARKELERIAAVEAITREEEMIEDDSMWESAVPKTQKRKSEEDCSISDVAIAIEVEEESAPKELSVEIGDEAAALMEKGQEESRQKEQGSKEEPSSLKGRSSLKQRLKDLIALASSERQDS